MGTWRIAVGSMRRPKLEVVRDSASAMSSMRGREEATTALLGTEATMEVTGYEVESGVSHTPSSREELMRGARQRAEALQAKLEAEGAAADFFVGLEGGLDVVIQDGRKRVFLESWAYVSNGQYGHFGCSGSIELPDVLADEVLTCGTELGVAIDTYAGAVGIRDSEGAWGILSGGLISRKESFRLAVIAAFAPFYNAKMYRVRSAGAADVKLAKGCIL